MPAKNLALQTILEEQSQAHPTRVNLYRKIEEHFKKKVLCYRSLASGMMAGATNKDIEKKISVFLTPKQKRSHGRPIYHDEAMQCGLKINLLDVTSDIWGVITELNMRLDNFVNNHAVKCIETLDRSFSAKGNQS